MLREIERQSTQAWHIKSTPEKVDAYGLDEGKWGSAIAAWDYMFVDIPTHVPADCNWQAEVGSV